MNRCKAETRCRKLDVQPDGTKLPAITDQPLCEACLTLIRDRVISSLSQDFDALHVLMGQKQLQPNEKITHTRTPGIPLSVEPERLMTELVFYADLAAVMVSDLLEVEYPPSEPVKKDPQGRELESIGDRQTRRRRQVTVLDAAQQRLTPHFEKLVDVETQPVAMWFNGEAVEIQPASWEKTAPTRYIGLDGQGRQILKAKGWVLEDISGVQVALKLWELHDKIRGMFGGRAKDQKDVMASPCPFYNDYHPDTKRTLFRRHGEDIIYCSKCPRGKGKTGWTYDEYRNLEFQVSVMFSEEAAVDRKQLDELEALRQKIPELEERLAAAEAKATRLERGFAAATDPLFASMPASQFASVVLGEAS